MKNLILYLPVVHQGHLDLFKKVKPNKVLILGHELINEFSILERDIRALAPESIKLMVSSLELSFEIDVLNRQILEELSNCRDIQLAMPKEDISEILAEKYFPGREIEWHDVFLRWHRWNAKAKSKINPDHILSQSEIDKSHLAKAFQSAKKSPDWWRQVGVVVVNRVGMVIYTTYNKHSPSERTVYINGDPRSNFEAGEGIDLSCALHGERDAISWAACHGVALKDTSLYVTTFPCPGCARAIVTAGIKKVFYAEGYSLLDSDQVLKSFGVEINRVDFEL